MTRRRLVGVVAALVVLAVAAGVPDATAHTSVIRTVPVPGATVDAPVDEVVITFLDPVMPEVTEIEVVDADGRPASGRSPVEHTDDAETARLGFDPLGAGDHIVSFTFASLDGDVQRDSFQFTVRAPAPAPDDDSGLGVGAAVGIGAVALAVAAAVGLAVRRRSSAD